MVGKIVFVALVSIGSRVSAGPVRVSLNTNGFALISQPVFRTQQLQKEGTVILELGLSPQGTVMQSKALAGDPELKAISVESARTWRFVEVKELPATLQVYVYFITDDGSMRGPPPAPPPPPFGATIGQIDIGGLPDNSRERLMRSVGIKVGDNITEKAFNHARTVAREFDPPMSFKMTLDGAGKLRLQFDARGR